MIETSTVTRLALAGANGRMGRSIQDAIGSRSDFLIVGALQKTKPDVDAILGSNRELLDAVDVIIDFTNAINSVALAETCAVLGRPALVIGSTGQSSELVARIQVASSAVPIIRSGNFSFGLNLMLSLVEKAGAVFLPESWDASIHETHHKSKIDRPSGTAMMLQQAVIEGRKKGLAPEWGHAVFDVDIQTSRCGGVIGEHVVTFGSEAETISFRHSAISREAFSRGTLEAAKWIERKPPGLYDMAELFGLQNI